MTDPARALSARPELEALHQASDRLRTISDRLRVQAGAAVRQRSAQLDAALAQVASTPLAPLASPSAAVGWVGVAGALVLAASATTLTLAQGLACLVVTMGSAALGLLHPAPLQARSLLAVLPALLLSSLVVGLTLVAGGLDLATRDAIGWALGACGLMTLALSLRRQQQTMSTLTERVCGSLAMAGALVSLGA